MLLGWVITAIRLLSQRVTLLGRYSVLPLKRSLLDLSFGIPDIARADTIVSQLYRGQWSNGY